MANNTKPAGNAKQPAKKKTPSVPDIGKKAGTNKTAKTGGAAKQGAKQVEKKDDIEKDYSSKRQKMAIVFAAVSAVLFAVALISGESAWLVMHNFSFRVFGLCMYVIPVIFLYLAFVYAKNKSIGSAALNLTGGGLFAVIACMLIHILSKLGAITDTGEKYLSSFAVSEQIKEVWNSTAPNKTGGVTGAALGGGLAHFLGQTGSTIILVILLVVIVMLVSNMTLGGVFKAISKPVKKAGEIASEKIEQRAEIRESKKFNPPETKPISTKSKTEEKPKSEEKKPSFSDSFVTDESTFKIRNHNEKHNGFGADIPIVGIPSETAPVPAASAVNPAKKKKSVNKADEKPQQETAAPVSAKEEQHGTEYKYPPIDCLKIRENSSVDDNTEEMNTVAQKLIDTLDSFSVRAQLVGICRGPSVTRYEIEPDAGIKISKVTRLADDIALRLASSGVRIAAIPNKTAIGIEVPNRARQVVGMRDCVDTADFRNSKSKLNVALGKDIAGNIVFADLAKMPHILIAGTTGSGKSVCLNTMIISIIYNASPDDVKIVLIDPKQVEFTIYNGIPHLEVPVVANPRKAAGALGWAVKEMESRYQKFSENNVRDIRGYNQLAEKSDSLKKMHQFVIFIDELSDLMMVAPTEVEDSICRLAQMVRAASMHLVVATQRPSVNVITGVIKANIPSRIALSVSSQIDSRTILDTSGAEKLLGNGDMLFMPIGESKAKRLQGCYISDSEVEAVVEFVKQNSQAEYNDEVIKQIDSLAAASEAGKKKGSASPAIDETGSDGPSEDVIKALETLIKAGKASTTFLQNKLGWGYPKAARIMNELEECGYIAPKEGNKERRVLITLQQLYEMNSSNEGIHAPIDTGIVEQKSDDFDGFDSSEEQDLLEDADEEDEEAGFEDYDDLLAYDEEESPSDEKQDEIDFDFIPFDDSEA